MVVCACARGAMVWAMCVVLPEDHALPLMADDRHAPDTLFLVAEEDWRLYRQDCKGAGELTALDVLAEQGASTQIPETLDDVYERRVAAVPIRGTSPFPDPENMPTEVPGASASSQPPVMTHDGLGWFRSSKKPPAEAFEHVSQELDDLVRMATLARRVGHGDLIWYSWDGCDGKGRKERPAHGSSLLGITAAAAKKMLKNFERWFPKKHFDVALRDALEKDDHCRAELTACFLFPSVGHYDSHESGIERGVRWSKWEDSRVQEGTRKLTAAQRDRHLRSFAPSGWCPELIRFRTDAAAIESYTWLTLGARTFKPPLLLPEKLPKYPYYDPCGHLICLWDSWGKGHAVPHKDRGAHSPLEMILTTTAQIVHPEDDWPNMTAAKRRMWRARVADFHRRAFTEDLTVVAALVVSKVQS